MTEGPNDDPDDLPGGNAVDVMAALAAGGILVAAGSAPGGVMLAAALPVMARLVFDLDSNAGARRMIRGGQVLVPRRSS